MNTIAQDKDILEFLPQRPPVVMIDKLLYSDNERMISGLTVTSDNVFIERNHLSESGLVENIAQTVAAGVGYICKLENRKVPVGFIAAIKDLFIHRLPLTGTEIITEVVILNTVMGVTIVKGMVKQNEEIFAECEMRIFVKPD
jgi:predicted hotdog family 3-hydroxylacyl-ACP dehydratase